MASTTKIMTAIVALENSSLDKLVTVAPSAAGVEGSSVYLYAGEEVTMETLLYALMLQSANDAAAAIAYEIAGGIESFADMMNEKAASLGLHDTHFMNPHGLDDENHYTSAHDMALIAQAAFNNPTFVEIDSTTYYDVQPGQLVQYPDGWRYYAHHRMMKIHFSLPDKTKFVW